MCSRKPTGIFPPFGLWVSFSNYPTQRRYLSADMVMGYQVFASKLSGDRLRILSGRSQKAGIISTDPVFEFRALNPKPRNHGPLSPLHQGSSRVVLPEIIFGVQTALCRLNASMQNSACCAVELKQGFSIPGSTAENIFLGGLSTLVINDAVMSFKSILFPLPSVLFLFTHVHHQSAMSSSQ